MLWKRCFVASETAISFALMVELGDWETKVRLEGWVGLVLAFSVTVEHSTPVLYIWNEKSLVLCSQYSKILRLPWNSYDRLVASLKFLNWMAEIIGSTSTKTIEGVYISPVSNNQICLLCTKVITNKDF